ncbi:hypothetical protein B0H16DRAFT_1504939 [Mycena metata]|uniref:RanBD1 domain-containing protein n=1 Tax=Mycena metata TaxID=1033252 RepID=A0AAD7K302_9AGAR|nr:hypothetical protein B0H16DRAFT_1504939 [Mycena metata]
MIPVADFNFVVCGFATLAATVGYAYTRKARPLPSRTLSQHALRDEFISDSSPADVVPEKSMDEVDSKEEEKPLPETAPEASPNTFLEKAMPDLDYSAESITVLETAAITPETAVVLPETSPMVTETAPFLLVKNSSLKRKRTHEQEEVDPEMAYPNNLKSIYPPHKRRSGSVSDEEPTEVTKETIVELCESPTAEKPLLTAPSTDPVLVPKLEESALPEAPKPQPIFTEVPRFMFPQSPPRVTHFPSTRSTTGSPGFANFAGSSSPFFSPSPYSAAKPIWLSTAENKAEGECEGESEPALAAAKTASTLAIQTLSTGEEEEDVTLELKGVKLYVKRGEANFSGGMVGHIKLLSHKTTLSKRLLFRREPLWKVSMNVRLQPTVRCTFDAQENVLRIALKELEDKWESGSGSATAAPQTVIYAFKPSRSCRKGDFQDFAEALLAQAREGGQS